MPDKRRHLFKSAEQRDAEAADAREAQREREDERRRREFDATPQGQARTAFERGLDWFEIELNLRGDRQGVATTSNAARNRQHLTLIENEGWSLVDVNHVFVPRHAHGSGGEAGSETFRFDGDIVGIYMFRRDGSKRQAQS